MKKKNIDKETLIREKAIGLIVKAGFDGLSMHKLARAADMSVSTIYLYFENREDLLNKLFTGIQKNYSRVILHEFTPELKFDQGLWLLWKNHLKFVTLYPLQYNFHEQFSHSPLVGNKDVVSDDFKTAISIFAKNAIRNGEIKKLKPDILWSLAFGPFYQIMKFEKDQADASGKTPPISDQRLRKVFDLVMTCLKP